MKIRPVGAELFHADGRIERHDGSSVACRSFSNAPKTEMPCYSNALTARVPVSPPK